MAGVGALRHSGESPPCAPQVISTELLAQQQPTTRATMRQPNHPTPAPAVRQTPMTSRAPQPQPASRFQIATVEFSPSFEIASIVLNATSKNVSVQLPGAGPSAVEGAPVFEIANVQLTGSGEIGMMQLNAQGAAPKAA